MREYVFFEQLLRGHEGDKACPEFDESASYHDRPSFAQSYLSNTSSLMQSFQQAGGNNSSSMARFNMR